MILNAYYKGLAAMFTGGVDDTTKDVTGGNKKVVLSSNSSHKSNFLNYSMSLSEIATLSMDYPSSGGGVVFGTGDTPPTLNDYKLAGDIVTGLSWSANKAAEQVEGGAGITVTFTVTNNNDSEVTIREVGYVGRHNNAVTTAYAVLLDRTVLEAPVTIPAGGVGLITYTVKLIYPTE